MPIGCTLKDQRGAGEGGEVPRTNQSVEFIYRLREIPVRRVSRQAVAYPCGGPLRRLRLPIDLRAAGGSGRQPLARRGPGKCRASERGRGRPSFPKGAVRWLP